jgi:hypothetical protein
MSVRSSALTHVRYRSGERKFDVMFKGERPYEYSNVPRSKFREFLAAESKGTFINKKIKPFYPQRQLRSDEV